MSDYIPRERKEKRMKEIKNHIICGFPGVGKSQAAMRSRDIQDIESTPFHMPIDWDNINEPEKMRHEENPNWVSDYADHIADMASQYGYCYNLISCHEKVREELDARSIPYIIVVPSRELKDEYLGRYLRRGDSFDFINQIDTHWDEWLTEIDGCGMPVIHLKSGQYISDILPIPKG